MALLLKTNQEKFGGAKSRKELPAHTMSCKTNPEEFGRGPVEEGGDDLSCPETLMLESMLAERCMCH